MYLGVPCRALALGFLTQQLWGGAQECAFQPVAGRGDRGPGPHLENHWPAGARTLVLHSLSPANSPRRAHAAKTPVGLYNPLDHVLLSEPYPPTWLAVPRPGPLLILQGSGQCRLLKQPSVTTPGTASPGRPSSFSLCFSAHPARSGDLGLCSQAGVSVSAYSCPFLSPFLDEDSFRPDCVFTTVTPTPAHSPCHTAGARKTCVK